MLESLKDLTFEEVQGMAEIRFLSSVSLADIHEIVELEARSQEFIEAVRRSFLVASLCDMNRFLDEGERYEEPSRLDHWIGVHSPVWCQARENWIVLMLYRQRGHLADFVKLRSTAA